MTTAREKARQAAINKAWDEGSEIVESGDGRIADLADAASDIWEEKFKEAVRLGRYNQYHRLISLEKEVLGENK